MDRVSGLHQWNEVKRMQQCQAINKRQAMKHHPAIHHDLRDSEYGEPGVHNGVGPHHTSQSGLLLELNCICNLIGFEPAFTGVDGPDRISTGSMMGMYTTLSLLYIMGDIIDACKANCLIDMMSSFDLLCHSLSFINVLVALSFSSST